MEWTLLARHFSTARMERYRTAREGNHSLAAHDYAHNLRLAQAIMPMLNVLEVATRNGIDHRLKQLYGRGDWWTCWAADPTFKWQNQEIAKALIKLGKRRERAHPDKVIAELTFGFWVSLFNSTLQPALWKSLRLVFAHCPKHRRQRRTISACLNQARDLRNRIFHHEPLLWLAPDLITQHDIAAGIIEWIDPNLCRWLGQYDPLHSIRPPSS